MKVSPNFIIVGVARCGTTSLYHYLKQHPEIGFPKIKEPKFFSSLQLTFPHKGPGDLTVDDKVIKKEEEYFSLFQSLSSYPAIGEASSDYFYYYQHTIPEIKKKLGDVKIIICLRNPMDRAYSAYSNMVRDSRETLSFEDALKMEESRIIDNWDWMWAYKGGGMYSKALQNFKDNFSNVKVIFSDDLDENPNAVLNEVFSFLKVTPNVSIDYGTRYSHSGKPKNAIIAMLTDRNNKFFYTIREIVIKMVPRKYLEQLAAKMFAKDTTPNTIRTQLRNHFATDIQQVEKLTDKDLSHWK